jgi:hypothetical protein
MLCITVGNAVLLPPLRCLCHSHQKALNICSISALLPGQCCCHICSPNEQQGGFLREWLASHLEAAESIGMPLLRCLLAQYET